MRWLARIALLTGTIGLTYAGYALAQGVAQTDLVSAVFSQEHGLIAGLMIAVGALWVALRKAQAGRLEDAKLSADSHKEQREYFIALMEKQHAHSLAQHAVLERVSVLLARIEGRL